jgi:hypothetical protein
MNIRQCLQATISRYTVCYELQSQFTLSVAESRKKKSRLVRRIFYVQKYLQQFQGVKDAVM